VQPHDETNIRLDRDRHSDVLDFGAPPRQPGRWRRWPLPVVLALAVVVAGVIAFRSRGDEPSAAPSPSAGTLSATPSTSVSAQASSDGRPVTSGIGHPLLGVSAGWELFLRSDTEVIRIEMAAGRITHTPIPALTSSGSVWFLAVPDGALVRPLDNVAGYLVKDGSTAAPLTGALAASGPALPGPQPGTLWVFAAANSGPGRLQLVNSLGADMGQTLSLPTSMENGPYSDGSGNILFSGVGGVYALGPNGAQRISTGKLVAAGPTRWLTEECDDRAQCALVAINKSSGARHALPVADMPNFFFPGIVSPDGRYAVVVEHPSDTQKSVATIIDLTRGERLSRSLSINPRYEEGGELAWSPDSRWLLAIGDDSAVHAIDVAANTMVDLGINLPPVYQLAVRPPRG
jgi:hypothetical protein